LQNHIFLLPLYNDWKSVQKLIGEINNQIKKVKKKALILIIDDNSTKSQKLNIKAFRYIKNIKILSLRKNLGSQKAIAVGLKYLNSKKQKSIITILDSDGEDDSSQIAHMIKKAELNPDFVIVSCRTKRGEGIIFSWFYILHKFLTFIFTFKWINFGNYSSFDSKNLSNILKNNNAWLAYSSAVADNCNIKKVYAARKKRFFGKSKLSLFGLFLHSLRVMSVFLYRVIFFSFIYVCFVIYLKDFLNHYFNIVVALILFLNMLISLTYILMRPYNFNKSLDLIRKNKS
tara:strand:- start:3 stop:863 length:861 start_codon:yes stop_codon:yes gene_type:complete